MPVLSILLADDQRLFVDNLKIVLESRMKDVRIVGIAANGAEAVRMTEALQPSIVLMDVRMPVMDGVAATRIVHRRHPEIRIVMLTTFDDDEYVHQALEYGAVGYILKTASPSELISSLAAVRDGAVLLSPSVADKLLRREQAPRAPSPVLMTREEMEAVLRTLTPREREFLHLISLAYDNRHIAEKLFIAEQTAKNAISSIMAKVGVSRRTQLMRFYEDCRQLGLVG